MPDPNTHATVPIIFSEDMPALSPCILSCDQQDNWHDWQPTIIIGYYQCTHCDALGVCRVCVSTVRGKAIITGTCQAHFQVDVTPGQQDQEAREEVLQ